MRPIATLQSVYGPQANPTLSSGQMAINSPLGASQTQSGQQAVPVTSLFPALSKSFLARPVYWLVGFVLFLVAWKLLEEHRGGREAFTELKIGGQNMFKVGIMALIFFAIVRLLATRYSIPGASPFVLFALGGTGSNSSQ